MDEKRPKRRKDKYNPYTLTEKEDKHFLSFQDGQGVLQEIQITKELFEVLNRFELDDLAVLNEWDRHYEHSELTEASLNARAFEQSETVEEIAMQHIRIEQLHKAIAMLPDKQRSRLILYYFGELTYAQIAELERCTIMPVKRSIDAAIENLKKFLM